MSRSKASKRSRPPAKRKRMKKVAAEVSNSHTNTTHINTYGHWVSEMSNMSPERKSVVESSSFKRLSL